MQQRPAEERCERYSIGPSELLFARPQEGGDGSLQPFTAYTVGSRFAAVCRQLVEKGHREFTRFRP